MTTSSCAIEKQVFSIILSIQYSRKYHVKHSAISKSKVFNDIYETLKDSL